MSMFVNKRNRYKKNTWDSVSFSLKISIQNILTWSWASASAPSANIQLHHWQNGSRFDDNRYEKGVFYN